MPTVESSLARVLKALLSTGDVTLSEVEVLTAGYCPMRGLRLSVHSSVILDGTHGLAVRDACGIAIDDAIPADSPIRCGCRETYSEYLVDGCPLHDPKLNGD